jgi:hypothetical protein
MHCHVFDATDHALVLQYSMQKLRQQRKPWIMTWSMLARLMHAVYHGEKDEL